MSRIILLLSACILAIAAAEGEAGGGGGGRGAGGGDLEARADRIFERVDRNKDGVVSEDELPERMRQAFKAMDADGDGSVSREENRGFIAERMGRQGGRQQDGQQQDGGRQAGGRQAPGQGDRRGAAVEPDHADVPYGPHPKQAFDVYLAEGPGPHPVAVFIHGGGFRGGDKSRINVGILEGLRAKGITMVAVNYRLSDVGPYPMQMNDGARAVQTIRAYAAHYDIDPARLAVFGGSAGAGISQWLAMHDDMAEAMSNDPVAMQSTKPSCAVGMAAQTTYDPREHARIFGIDHVDEALIPFFGMQSADDVADERFHPLFEDASPITHLDADDPPVLLTYGQEDSPIGPDMERRLLIHHPEFGRHMVKKAEELGAEVRFIRREDLEGNPQQAQADAVVSFIAGHLLGAASE